MKTKNILFTVITLCLLIGVNGCEEGEKDGIQLEGYIIGYDPCTIQQHSRVGYIIVSADLKDTVVTYNISDVTYKMPASIFSHSGDTLYKVPGNYFDTLTYFPTQARYDFKVHITYRYPKVNESYSSPCLALYLSNQPNREIIVESITK